MIRKRHVLVSAFAISLLTGSSASASDFDYSVKDLTLEKVAEDLSVITGAAVIISEGQGTIVRNWSFKGTRRQIIADLARRSLLHFNFDGSVYELTPKRSVTSQVLRIPSSDRADAAAKIRQAFPAFSADAVGWVKAADGYSLIIRGSKRFNETVTSLLKPCTDNCRSVNVLRYGQAER